MRNFIHKIEPSLGLVYGLIFDHFRPQDILLINEVMWQDPLRRPGMRIIIDISLVTEMEYDSTTMQDQIEMNRQFMAQGHELERTALIVRNDFDITFSKIIETRAKVDVPVVMKAFMTLPEAVDWLGLSEAYNQVAAIQQELQHKAMGLMGIEE